MIVKKLFYGTWELDGILKNISTSEAIKLLKYAKQQGINKFDTALVYGNGKVEKMLSKVVTDDDIVLTKIPAIVKPDIDSTNIKKYYPNEYVLQKFRESMHNLNRNYIDIVLLHNWSTNWKDLSPLIELSALKKKGLIKHIGISLPNNYKKRLDEDVLSLIDYIEVPYNDDNTWILNDIDYYKKHKIEIIIRSLFMQGKLIKSNTKIVEKKIKEIKKLGTHVVIGMTSKEQIDENIELIN